ncbi:MAG: Mu transposase C-terminal domain-containing protein [Campylobacterales bacterium]
MGKINLSVGSTVLYENEPFEITGQPDLKTVLAKAGDGTTHILPIEKLSQPTDAAKPINAPEIPGQVSGKDWDEANRRLRIIRPLIEGNPTLEEIDIIASEHNLHRTTLYRWRQRYLASGLLESLLPHHSDKGGKGGVRVREEQELLIQKAIEELYLSRQKMTVSRVHKELVTWCRNAGIEPPHQNTLRNRIAALSAKKAMKAREGVRAADRRYRNADGMFPEGNWPLDVVQIDHTKMDIMLVDEKYRQPIGRPYLTLAIDVYSRMVAGFFVSLDEPGYFSVAQCLSQAVLPKEKFLRDLGVEGEWNLWGLPRAIHMDNAAEFRGLELQRVCEQYGIGIAWRPVARPQFGGHIERLIGTSMREVHTLPGTTFSNIQMRGDYKPDKYAVMTLHELERWLSEFFVNIYHKTVHSGIRTTPEKKYEAGIFGDDERPGRGLPEKIADEDRFRISLLPTAERTIQHIGVSLDNIRYYADSLRRWIKAKDDKGRPRKFIFKRDPRDISVIWFFDPDIREYFPVPYRNMSNPPASIWDVRAARRYLEEKNLPDDDEQNIFAAMEKMKAIREEAAAKTKGVRREIASVEARERKRNQDFPQQSHSSEKAITAKSASLDDLFSDVKPFEEIEAKKGKQ